MKKYIPLILTIFALISCSKDNDAKILYKYQKDLPTNVSIAKLLKNNYLNSNEESTNINSVIENLTYKQKNYYDLYNYVFIGLDKGINQKLKLNNSLLLFQNLSKRTDKAKPYFSSIAFYKTPNDTIVNSVMTGDLFEKKNPDLEIFNDLLDDEPKNHARTALFEKHRGKMDIEWAKNRLNTISKTKYLIIAKIKTRAKTNEEKPVNIYFYQCEIFEVENQQKISDFYIFTKDSKSFFDEIIDNRRDLFKLWMKGDIPDKYFDYEE